MSSSFSAARFVDRFLLPLLEGRTVFVSRPLGQSALAGVLQAQPEISGERLARFLSARLAVGRGLLAEFDPGGISSEDLRIGLVLYNLLALGHPERLAIFLREGTRKRALLEKVLELTTQAARLGPPPDAQSAVRRHVLVSAFERLQRPEHHLDYWLGHRVFIGRPVPRRLYAWARLRRVRVATVSRCWLSEVGLPPGTRPVWEALQEAAPLGGALDPTRPDLDWHRAYDVLRFAPLARLVASRVFEQGLVRAGEAYARALMAYASRGDEDVPDFPWRLQGGLRFLGYLLWLSSICPAGADGGPGPLLSALLVAAWSQEPALLLPDEITAGGVGNERWHSQRALMASVVAGLAESAQRVSDDEAKTCRRIALTAASRKIPANRIR